MDEEIGKHNDLYFKSRSKQEVVKVPNCTFSNDVKEISTFYFCICSNDDEFFPICEACSKTCHKKHNPTLNISGVYICKCGVCNHEISEANETLFNQRRNNQLSKCIYSKFMDITPSTGYFLKGNKTYCAVCAQFCLQNNQDKDQLIEDDDEQEKSKEGLQKIDGQAICSCQNHFEVNYVNLNLDLNSNPQFHLHFQNFNYNILSKIPATEEKFIKYLVAEIKKYSEGINFYDSKDFFSNFFINKTLEIFSMFSHKWENKFFHIKNYFIGLNPDGLVALMAFRENSANINEAIRGDFFLAKFYFAEMIFNYLIRSYLLKYNNIWNVRTIINMNLYQRMLYLNNVKEFFRFHTEEDNVYPERTISNMITNLLEIYDNILKFNDSETEDSTLRNNLFSYIFPTFTSIFKYLTKANLLTAEQSSKYFELVLDSIKMFQGNSKKNEGEEKLQDPHKTIEKNNSKKQTESDPIFEHQGKESDQSLSFDDEESKNNNDKDKDISINNEEKNEDSDEGKLKSTYYIMKSILYTLIYHNDQVCINYMKNTIDEGNQNYAFMKNINIEKICKVFASIINLCLRKQDLSRTVIYDFYVRKIMELLIGKDDFYHKSLANISALQEYEIRMLTSFDYFNEVQQYLSKPYLQQFTDFDYKMNDYNRQYFDYALNANAYLSKTKELFEDLKAFIIREIGSLPDLSLKYLNSNTYQNKEIDSNIKALQDVVKYSIFFQKMEEYIHIYTEGIKTLEQNEDAALSTSLRIHQEILSFLLKFFYVLIYRNSPNLCLIMNIKPKNFVSTFIIVSSDFFDFLERMTEMMYNDQYDIDNYYFFSECLCMITHQVTDYFSKEERTKEKDIINLNYLGKVFKLLNHILNKTTIKQPETVNVIDAIQVFIELVNKESHMKDIRILLSSYFRSPAKHQVLQTVITHYLLYLSELIDNDFLFFNAHYFRYYIIEMNSIINSLTQDCESHSLPIEVEHAVYNFYIKYQITFGFTINKIDNQILRLFQTNDNQQDHIISNISLANLAISKETRTDEDLENTLRIRIDDFKENAEVLCKLNKRFQTTFDNLFQQATGFTSAFELKVIFYKYFEDILVRPTYKLFNLFLIHGTVIDGRDCTIYHQLLFELLKNIAYFYDKINKKINGVFNEEIEEYYKSLYNRTNIFEYENISVMKELTFTELQDIISDIQTVKSSKYYHFEQLYTILHNNVERIFYIKPKLMSSIKTETMKKKKIITKPYYNERAESLAQHYYYKANSTYDTELSLFSALKASEKDMDIEIGKEILLYLLYRLSDQLTDENYGRMIDTYQRGTLKEIIYPNFKLQNSYVLISLNALFYNYSEKFQADLSQSLGKLFPQIFEFLSKDLIFSCCLNEVSKMYTLDRVSNFKQGSGEKKNTLSSEICSLSIKFLQNMCESHNRIFQNRFFKFMFNMNNYIYQRAQHQYENSHHSLKKMRSSIKHKSLKDEDTTIKRYSLVGLERSNSLTPSPDQKQSSLIGLMKARIKSEAELEMKKEEEQKKYLDNVKYCFFNFLIHNMRMLTENLHSSGSPQSIMLRKTQELKSTEHILEIYGKLSDLIIEMIQGTQSSNFDFFYLKLTNKNELFLDNEKVNTEILPSFTFLQQCLELKKILFNQTTLFDLQTVQMKHSMFAIIINVISQEMVDTSIIPVLLILFPPDQVIKTVSRYLRATMIKHIELIEYDDPSFESFYTSFELNNKNYTILKDFYKSNMEIFEDDFFKLAGQMYLFLTILGKKYHIQEVERVIKYNEKELVETMNEDDENKSFLYSKISGAAKGLINPSIGQIGNFGKMMMIKGLGQLERNDGKPKHEVNNYIIASKFFNKIIKSCEFMIENENKFDIKTLYFLTDPRVYYISKNNFEKFKDEVDRSSSTNKLKSLLNNLNAFLSEVDFKYTRMKKTKYLKWMFAIEYKNIDLFNFCSSLAINFMLLLLLDQNRSMTFFVHILTMSMAGFQIFVNLIYLTIFLLSKYHFYVILAKNQYGGGKEMKLLDYAKVYLIDSFILNEEINMMLLIILLAIFGMISEYATFLFTIQLLSVIKFVATIKEIVLAFQLRVGQLLSMIGFLGIFLFFCASLSYYFFNFEFDVELSYGTGNICSNLLECWITYFNLGVRSGGGIGDILQDKEFNTTIYWVRWVNDLIFFTVVILMLMNMINGVIVSTFSQIREESSAKEEDIKNKCFICNIDRTAFERLKINFEDHLKNEHNIKTYIRFLICLKMANPKDLDADQSFILDAISNREIKCFPVNHASSLGEINEEDDDDDETDG